MTRFSNYRIAFGAVLVAAFVSAAGMLLQAEPPQAVGTWASIGATPDSRVGAAAVALADGRTLIAGGSIQGTPTDTVVIFNPADGSFASAGQLLAPRVGHTATLLDDGRVLIVGGTVAGLLRNDLELFDPSSGTSEPSATMPQPRSGHAAARLADGTVLIAGGTTTDGVVLQTAEIFDPSTGSTTPTTLPMLMPRTGASATTLIDGRVLIAGGSSNGSVDLASAEIYQPWSQLFEAVDTGMSVARSGHAAVLLPWNNSVLIAGGTSDGVAQLTSDLFLPAEFPDPYSYGIGHFGPTGSMAAPRVHATAAPHIEGYAVAMGGGAPDAEVYRFATVKTDKDDYAPGVHALITGSGWEPNSEVTLLFQEDPAVHDDYVLPHVPTDSEGNFTWDQWAPEEHDLNVRFYLMAKQATPQGERRAQMTFTDSKPNTVAVSGQSPNPVVAGGSATYTVTVNFNGNNNSCTVPLSISPTLPVGVNASFSPSSVTSTGAGPDPTSTLTLSTTLGTAPIGTTSFTVLAVATNVGGCQSATASNTGTLVVFAPPTTTTTNSATGNFGGTVSLSSHSQLTSGASVPSGSQINFFLNGNPVGSATTTGGSGNASLGVASLAGIPVGSYPTGVTATLVATSSYATSTGTNILTVNAATTATTTTVASSQDPSTFGQPVSFTATVAPSSGATAPTGSVQFVVDGVNFGSPVALSASGSNGVATSGSTATLNVAGSPHSVTANYTATGIFTSSSGSLAGGQAVNKASTTTTVTCGPGPFTYTGAAQTPCSANVTGAGGLNQSLTVNYTSNVNAGTATANASFAATANYLASSDSKNFSIGKAAAVISVSGFTGPYDAAPHGATGSATGVDAGGAALGSTLNLGASFTGVPGGTANWTFAGGTNYNDQSGTAAIVINKANATVTVNGYTGVYDAAPHGASGTATGIGAVVLAGLDLGASFTNVPGGTASWTFTDVTGNYNNTSGTAAIVISKADATVTVTGYTGVYDAAPHGATGSATGISAVVLAGLDLGASFTNVPGGTASWTFTDVTGNYNNTSGTAAIVISKADATVTVTGFTGVYDAAPHGATGSATGISAVVLAGLDLGASFTNVPGGTASWTFTDVTGNYNNTSGTAAIVISKADATVTVTGYTGVYDAAPHGATGSATGISAVVLAGLDLGASFTNVPGGTASWTFTDVTGNYNNTSGTAAIVISKADATVTVTGYTGVYDAAPHGATGSATGISAVVLAGLDLGTSFTNVPGGTASWTFTDVTGNYNNTSGTAAIVISKADATVTVTGYTGVYDAAPHGATGSATGISAVVLAGLDLGASFTNVPGGTASWTFTDVTGNYNNTSGTAAIVISKADATVTVTGYTGVYDAAAHGASGTATGVASVDLSAGLNFGATFTSVPGGTANWTFAGGTNYNDQSGTAAIVISKADATVTVTGYTGVYDAAAHGASGTATGVGSVDLSAGLNFGATFTSVPGGTANWTFAGGTNYNDQSGVAAIVISKADATVVVNGYTGTYDAAAHGASGTATGVGSVDLSAGLNFGATFTSVPGGTANWTFAGGTNYNDQSGAAAIVISKADATVVVNGYTGTYDAAAHGASGTATGVGSVDLSAGLNFGATFTSVPGGTANWTFAGGTNYNDQSGAAAIVISKADATVVVNGYTGTYDAAAHGASGTATGVGSVDLSAGLNFGATFTSVPGGTANWTFAGGTNYNDQSGAAAIVISKADATVVVNGYTGTYDAAAHGASGTATGVGSVDLSAGLNFGATFTSVPGGTANWTFAGGTNYNDQSGAAAIVISKADATVVVNGYTGTYDAAAHGASGTATGVGSVDLSAGLNFGATFTSVPGGTANWTFAGGTNYNDQSGAAAIVISKADATVVVNGYTGTYDAAAHGASGTATGVGSVDLSAGLNFGATFTSVPGGTANWTFAGGTNYNDQSGTAAIVISKANAVTVVTPYSATYDSFAHTATGTATGVLSESLSGLDLNGTTHTNAGDYLTDPWTFTDVTGNYNNANGTVHDSIGKTNATVTVSGYTGTYDAAAHGATATIAGVVGDPSAAGSSFNPGASFINVPGGTANWTFTGGTNYTDQSGTAAIVINKANATVSVTGYTGTYDAAAHGATGTATGVDAGGAALGSTLNLGASFTNVPGGTANWTFTGGTNYNGQSGTAAIVINKANATVLVTGYTGTYNAAAHGATGTTTGVDAGGAALGSTLNLGASFTNVPGGTANWTLAGGTNYNDQSGTAAIVINKANATVTVTPYNVIYDGASHTAVGTAKGVMLESLSGLALGGTTHVPAGDYLTDPWTFTDVTGNYNNASLTVHDRITYSTGACLGQPGHQILQPINADGTSVVKKGSTVPAKFRVCDINGNSVGTPGVVTSFQLIQTTAGTVVNYITEEVLSTTPDSSFRWDSTDKQWIFNVSTKNLSPNVTYKYAITLNDGSVINFQFGAK